jgi:phosphate uptake regulator
LNRQRENPTPNDSPIERKVQMAGGSTFTVSIPREWGTRHGLSKGDPLYLYPHRDRLVLAPATVDGEPNTARIAVGDVSEEGITQQLMGAYTGGCDRITVVDEGGLDDGVVRAVTDTVEDFIGMEVGTVTDTEVVIRDHLNPDAVSPRQAIGQIRGLALELQGSAVEALRTDDATLARTVHERDNQVDRLFAFVARCLHRGLEDVNELGRLGTTRRSAFHYYKTARELERVADKAERIADAALAQSGSPDAALGEEFEELVSGATEVVTLALSGDSDAAIEAYRGVVERLDAVDAALAAGDDPDAYRYGTDVIESVRRTAAHGLNIVNMSVEAAVEGLPEEEARTPY